jgi:hypothetical protein
LLLSKRKKGVEAMIYTEKISQQLDLDIQKHTTQYPSIEVKTYKKNHDRFLIIDEEVYHIGASIKDLGNRLFAFSKLGLDKKELVDKVERGK